MSTRPAAATSATAGATATKKKRNKGNRHVFITERKRYLSFDVPSVDTVIEEDKLEKRLVVARSEGDWKAEAHALMQLGQLMKWKGRLEVGDDLLAQSAEILRAHTFAEGDDPEEDDF